MPFDLDPREVCRTRLGEVRARSLAIALAPRITVNGLALGAVLPPSDGNQSPSILVSVPARRWASLEEVEEALLFLLAGPAYISGEIIHLDGGRHLV